MRTASRVRAFTLIELLVVISIIALLVAILLPALGRARQAAQQMKSNTQLRGIQMANFIFAQDHEGNYAGIDDIGGAYANDPALTFTDASDIDTFNPNTGDEFAGAFPQARFCILLEGNYFAPEYIRSPAERNDKFELWTSNPSSPYAGDGEDSRFTSYALPGWKRWHINEIYPGRILGSTADQLDASTPAASDRMLSLASPLWEGDWAEHTSLWSQGDSGWIGGMSFNDNHVEFLPTNGPTRKFTFGTGPPKPAGLGDNIFTYYPGGGQNPDNMWPTVIGGDGNVWMVVRSLDQSDYSGGDY